MQKSHCYLCSARTENHIALCHRCVEDISWNTSACSVCAAPLAEISARKICAICLKKDPFFHSSTIPLIYNYPIKNLIKLLKYKEKIFLSTFFSSILAQEIKTNNTDFPDAILAVPLHSLRYRKRGFNQSELIANDLQKQLGIPTISKICQRVINTSSQTGLALVSRKKNVRNAFSCKTLPSHVKHIAILDDVVTTGSTVNELARCLTLVGAEKIDVWACARAELT